MIQFSSGLIFFQIEMKIQIFNFQSRSLYLLHLKLQNILSSTLVESHKFWWTLLILIWFEILISTVIPSVEVNIDLAII